MKIILIIIFCIVSVQLIGQNRFDKLFAQADSAFNSQYGIREENHDSIVMEMIMDEISCDTSKITVTVEQLMSIHFISWIDGVTDYEQKGSFDMDALLKYLKMQRESLESYLRFLKGYAP